MVKSQNSSEIVRVRSDKVELRDMYEEVNKIKGVMLNFIKICSERDVKLSDLERRSQTLIENTNELASKGYYTVKNAKKNYQIAKCQRNIFIISALGATLCVFTVTSIVTTNFNSIFNT